MNMKKYEMTLYVYEEEMCLHRKDWHLEAPCRIKETYRYLLDNNIIIEKNRIRGRYAPDDELEICHSSRYIADVKSLVNYCTDSYLTSYSHQSASMAVGCTIELCKAVMNTKKNGIAIVRPPGHHASRDGGGSFCVYNNVAISALSLNRRVAIVDLDVHFGEGTYNLVKDIEEIKYVSIHRYDEGKFHPHTGHPSIEGNICWNTLDKKKKPDNSDYIHVFREKVLPSLIEFNPEIIIVSFGTDCVKGDPFTKMDVTPELFRYLFFYLKCIAPVASVLEGGYNLENIQKSMKACVEGLESEEIDDFVVKESEYTQI